MRSIYNARHLSPRHLQGAAVAATFVISARCLIHYQCLQRLKNQGIYCLFKLNFLYVTRETIIEKSKYKAIVFRQVLLFYIIWLSVDNE